MANAISPLPHATVQFQHHGFCFPGRSGRNTFGDFYRSIAVDACAIDHCAIKVAPPSPQAVVVTNHQRMVIADGNILEFRANENRDGRVFHQTDAQLAEPVVPPGQNNNVIISGQRICVAPATPVTPERMTAFGADTAVVSESTAD